MILFILIGLLLFFVLSKETFADTATTTNTTTNNTNTEIINRELIVKGEKCYYKDNQLYNGDKIVMELGDGKLYSTCDFGEPVNNSCNFGSFNNSDLVFITKDKSGKNKCRQKPYTLI
jgi:hypothetical protein